MMDRRAFVGGAVSALAVPLATEALSAGGVPRIGYLSPFSPTSESMKPMVEAFHRGLREAGWIPGDSVAIEYRWGEDKYDRLPGLAAELVRLDVDVIFAVTTGAGLAAKRATGTIPVVFTSLGDPVRAGLVASVARPGGNVTGVGGLAPELNGKRLELLKEVIPGVRRVAVLVNPLNPSHTQTMLPATRTATAMLAVQLQELEVRDPKHFGPAFAAVTKERSDAVTVLGDAMFFEHRREILSLVAKRRLPAIYVETGWATAGGLMSYAPSVPEMHRRAAAYVDKILKGAKPADLPVEQPTKYELVINLKTAKALGLTIPPAVLARADEVIQ